MKKAAVIGFPVAHSLSPAIFSFLCETLKKKDFEYDAVAVDPSDLKPFIKEARKKYIGLNVTLPHKQNAVVEIDSLTAEAQVLGAVNAIHFKEGEAIGYNTDVRGIADSLAENHIDLLKRRVLIIGAGGAARAMAYHAGIQEASHVLVFNKTFSKGQKLAADFSKIFKKTVFEACGEISELKTSFSLIVNATPVGMKGFEGHQEFSFSDLLSRISVSECRAFDLIYNPETTPFLKHAREKGMKTLGGLDMLIYQALGTWEIWFGPLKERDKLKAGLSQTLRKIFEQRPVFLCGFMGVGKSTVAKQLASNLGWTYVDTDDVIQQMAGKSIPEIFKSEGETRFRALEAQAIEKVSSLSRCIIALGGGALTRVENFERIHHSGSLIYLAASPEQITVRLKNSSETRPLLGQNGDKKKVDLHETVLNLLKAREPGYKKAQAEIHTDHKTVSQVADEIMSLIKTEKIK